MRNLTITPRHAHTHQVLCMVTVEPAQGCCTEASVSGLSLCSNEPRRSKYGERVLCCMHSMIASAETAGLGMIICGAGCCRGSGECKGLGKHANKPLLFPRG